MTVSVVPWVDYETYEYFWGTTYNYVTLTGGQQTVLSYSRRQGITTNPMEDVLALPQSTGRCSGSGALGPGTNEAYTVLATYKSTTVLTEGEVLTWRTYMEDLDGGLGGGPTFTGPTSAEIQTTTPFVGLYIPDNGRVVYMPYLPPDDRSCRSACGGCSFYYPEVTVNYWPVASVNTACVAGNDEGSNGGSNGTMPMTSAPSMPSEQAKVRYRALVGRGAQSITTNETENPSEVVSNGITYKSPSVYVEFPTLFAWDRCGKLGPEPTNMVRSYHPAQMSTIVYDSTFASQVFPFDFASAVCPPKSVADNQFWMALAKDRSHYNPIIQAPQDLTDINPWWSSCVPGPYQGHDPPSALTPYNNLAPNPTPPSSDSSVPALPAEVTTAMPEETGGFNPSAMPAVSIPSNPGPTTSPKQADPTTENSPAPSQEQQDPQESTPDLPEQNDTSPSRKNTPDPSPQATQGSSPQNTPAHSQENTPNSAEQNDPQPSAPEDTPTSPQNNTPEPTEVNDPTIPQQNTPSVNGLRQQNDPGQTPSPTPIHIDPTLEQPSLSILGTTIHVKPSSNLIIDSQTLTPGGSIQVSGTPVIFSKPEASDAPYNNDSADPKPKAPAPTLPAATVGSQVVAPNADSSFIVGDSTFAPGAVATVDGNTITLPTAQVSLPSAAVKPPPALTVGGSTFAPDASQNFVVSGQTIHAGNIATINGETITAPSAPPAAASLAPPHPVTIVGSNYTPDASSNFIISGSTYTPGATATIDGSTLTLPTPAPAPSVEEPGLLTVGGQAYTTGSASDYMISGQTLMPGGEITVGTETVSLGANPTVAVVGTSTVDVGDLVMSGLGGQASATVTTTDGTHVAVGGAGRVGLGRWWLGLGSALAVAWIV